MLIAGPTASGKSALAMQLADACSARGRPAWIVNADAMQVYDGLRVITARPSSGDEARLPHRLYGHVAPDRRYSVGAWLSDMEAVLRDAEGHGACAIIVGGTGLYFKALTEGLSEVPSVPADVRRDWDARAKITDPVTLHTMLAERDPETADTLRPSDRQRVQRALEVLDATGAGLSAWRRQGRRAALLAADDAPRIVLDTPRPVLHARIAARFDGMVDSGALDEVRALVARRLDPALPVMKAIGVREIAAYLDGEMSLESAIERAKTETRRYAKRQSTWLRTQMPDWPRVAGAA